MNMLQTVRALHGRSAFTAAHAAGTHDRIRTAEGSEEDAVLAALTRAFIHDPAVRWLYPDTGQYLRWFPRFARAFGGNALGLSTAHCIEGYAGCALWLPPAEGPDEEAVVDVVARSVAPDRQEEIFALLEVMGQAHPQEPHWYLPLIGVDGRHQRRGLGAALLRHALAACDRDGLPAYLEATSTENIPLYERHGFQPVASLRAGSCPTITAMWREPRRDATTSRGRTP
jgi:ribosomal protein S18 acetylase RimI-like enzyme